MADEAVVVEAPEVELGGGDEGVHAGGEGGEHQEGQERQEQVGERQEEGAGDAEPVTKDAAGQLKLSAATKSKLDAIKAEGPEGARLAKALRSSLFDQATLREKVPGGVKEVLALVDEIEELGGREGITASREELGAWKQLDEDFKAGKPEVAKDIAAGNPAAFCKIAPALFAQYNELDPAGYAHEIGKVATADLQASGIPLQMQRMADTIWADGQPRLDAQGNAVGFNEGKAVEARTWVMLAKWMDKMSSLAVTPGKGPKKGEAKPGEGEADGITQREQALTAREWGGERAKSLHKVSETEFSRLVGSRKPSATQVGAIKELFDSRLRRLLSGDAKHKATVDRFLGAGDKAGYLKHMNAQYRKFVPQAMATAVGAILPGKPGPKGKDGKDVKPGAKPGEPAKPTVQGVTRIMGAPPMKDLKFKNAVRWSSRTNQMEREGIFPMKDGTKRQYDRTQ